MNHIGLQYNQTLGVLNQIVNLCVLHAGNSLQNNIIGLFVKLGKVYFYGVKDVY